MALANGRPLSRIWLSTGFIFVAGLVLLWLGQLIDWHILKEFVRDFGIALIIAAAVTAVYEAYARDRATRETMEQMLERVLGDLVDQSIWRELKDQILDKPAVRRNARLNLWLSKPEKGPDHILVLTSELQYSLQSLRSTPREIKILHFVDEFMDNACSIKPKFNHVYVGGKKQPLTNDKRFEHKVTLAGRDTPGLEVDVERTELVYLPGAYNFILSELTELKSIVLKQVPDDVEVVVNCLFKEEKLTVESYLCPDKFLLPGQCLEIRFLKIQNTGTTIAQSLPRA